MHGVAALLAALLATHSFGAAWASLTLAERAAVITTGVKEIPHIVQLFDDLEKIGQIDHPHYEVVKSGQRLF